MTDHRQRLIDALQVVAPLAQRLKTTAAQQEQDAAALLDAAERAIQEARQVRRGDGDARGEADR